MGDSYWHACACLRFSPLTAVLYFSPLAAAMALAKKIAGMSRPVAMVTKEAVLASFEMNLAAGLEFERKIFRTTFGLQDRAEGMDAFLEKRVQQHSPSCSPLRVHCMTAFDCRTQSGSTSRNNAANCATRPNLCH